MKISDAYYFQVKVQRLQQVVKEITVLEDERRQIEDSLNWFANKHFEDEKLREEKEGTK